MSGFLNMTEKTMNNFLGYPDQVTLAEIERRYQSYIPLCFTAVEANSTIKLQYVDGTYKTSTDGKIWDDYELGTLCTLTNIGDKIYFSARDKNNSCKGNTQYGAFLMTGKIAAYGNIQYLLDSTGEQLSVPNYCYYYTFNNCSSLTQAPELPATTLANSCYNRMFYNCTSLTSAPSLPATILAYQCYISMFHSCTSLTQAPELPATTLANICYGGMFSGCTSLTSAPELPATTLALDCYSYMFRNCISLTQAPVLSAEALADYCYSYMFQNCENLKLTKDSTVPGAYQILSVDSTTAENWGQMMFSGTSKDFTENGARTGTAYYCY